MADWSVGWQMLMDGDIAGAALYPYTMLLGNMFWGGIAFMTLTMIYLKTNDFGTTGVAGLIMAAVYMAFLPPGIRFLSTIMLVLSVVIVLYKVFKG